MLIREFQDPDSTRLVALGQFLLGRAKDTAAKKTVNVNTFIGLARDMGIDITPERLQALASRDPLRNIIANIQGDTVVFKGAEETVAPEMNVDQARATVNQMAKRAIDIK
jgi:hypothetical protein